MLQSTEEGREPGEKLAQCLEKGAGKSAGSDGDLSLLTPATLQGDP